MEVQPCVSELLYCRTLAWSQSALESIQHTFTKPCIWLLLLTVLFSLEIVMVKTV